MESLDIMFKTGLYINDLSMHDSSRDLVLAGTQQSAELKLALDQVCISLIIENVRYFLWCAFAIILLNDNINHYGNKSMLNIAFFCVFPAWGLIVHT